VADITYLRLRERFV
jgi:putative transposase